MFDLLYALVHRALVRGVAAYRALTAVIAEVVAALPTPEEAAAVPASTGDWVPPLSGVQWTLIDCNNPALAMAQRRLPGCLPRRADLGEELPLPSGSQDLILCVHSLHALPDPPQQLRRFADRLAPGGHLVLVTFDGPETFRAFRARMRRQGTASFGMSVWKWLDVRITGTASYLPDAELCAVLTGCGLQAAAPPRSVFEGTSTLRVLQRS